MINSPGFYMAFKFFKLYLPIPGITLYLSYIIFKDELIFTKMKKSYRFQATLCLMALIFFLASIRIASAQVGKEKYVPIPDSINSIFQASCMICHGSDGGRLPTSRLNFSRWKGYGYAKEAEKAKLICSVLTKGIMPPRRLKESNPELIPTKDQVDLICTWADSFESRKVKK